ncbi:ABC transporter substrate-binding protein [Verrucomicrobium spinosum]|uniref:ABC transporter substrate-binding protein n=1 Tax=Verrucomicrobium spinosum TaxID=2736 RepID=UPI000B1A1160|nr:ABC transporter substrate-binding protein [Verrucomicrobium spinosum]
MAKFALARGWKKVAVMTDVTQDYSVGLSQYFKEYFTKNGGTIVGEQSYASGDKDFKAQLTSIKEGAPDAILASGYYNEVGLMSTQAKELGIQAPLLGGDGWDSPSLVQVAGKSIEAPSSPTTSPTRTPHPASRSSSPSTRPSTAPSDAMAALGYDSAMILVDAIKRAGTTEARLCVTRSPPPRTSKASPARSPWTPSATPTSPRSSSRSRTASSCTSKRSLPDFALGTLANSSDLTQQPHP